MAKNYYSILEISRDATYLDVENAYKRLAPIYHKSKTLHDLLAAKAKFENLAEAYEVLSDPRKRGVFDMHGEFGLKNGVPGDYSYACGQYWFSEDQAERVYEKFFGSCGALGNEDYNATEIGTMFREPFDGVEILEKTKPEDLVVKVPCTLSELYNGCNKTVTFKRRILNQTNKSTVREETATKDILIWKGYSNEIVLTYKNEGHQSTDHDSSDLVLKITEIPDVNFKLQGNDLIYIHTLPLIEALESRPFTIEALDGRTIAISPDEIVNPNSVYTVPNEGLPVLQYDKQGMDHGLSKKAQQAGKLIVRFRILFPRYISADKKAIMKSVLE